MTAAHAWAETRRGDPHWPAARNLAYYDAREALRVSDDDRQALRAFALTWGLTPRWQSVFTTARQDHHTARSRTAEPKDTTP